MVARGVGVIVFPQHGRAMNRTRATQASQPHIFVHPRPYGCRGRGVG